MKARKFIAVLAITISGIAATTSVATAAERTPTKVTIKGENGDFYGYVKSADAANCADERQVTLFEMLGATPDPKSDRKIVTDTASLNGSKYMWSAGNTGEQSGHFYARVKKTDYCGGDISKVVEA